MPDLQDLAMLKTTEKRVFVANQLIHVGKLGLLAKRQKIIRFPSCWNLADFEYLEMQLCQLETGETAVLGVFKTKCQVMNGGAAHD